MAADGVWHLHHCCPLFFRSAALPALCPACRQPLEANASPVPLPSPFRSAANNPRTVVIRPTVGEFEDYGGGDLHVGVTDASGQVVAFDAGGLRRCSAEEWTQCLVIPLPTSADEDISDNSNVDASEQTKDNVDNCAISTRGTSPGDHLWNKAVSSFITSKEWSPESYHETSRNCFSFLLAFLERAGALPSPGPWTKERFARECVLPVSRRAAKYLTLKRRTARDGWCALGEQAETGS